MESDNKEVLEKANRYLRLKNVHGKSVCVVREVYRRELVPCQSQLCISDCPNNAGKVWLRELVPFPSQLCISDCPSNAGKVCWRELVPCQSQVRGSSNKE